LATTKSDNPRQDRDTAVMKDTSSKDNKKLKEKSLFFFLSLRSKKSQNWDTAPPQK